MILDHPPAETGIEAVQAKVAIEILAAALSQRAMAEYAGLPALANLLDEAAEEALKHLRQTNIEDD